MKFLFYSFLLLITLELRDAFYISNYDKSEAENEQDLLLTDYNLQYDDKINEFPNNFNLNFKLDRQNYSIEFIKSSNNFDKKAPVYTTINGKVEKIVFNEDHNDISQVYVSKDGISLVTLILNNDISQTVSSDKKFRLIGNIPISLPDESRMDGHYVLEILPVVLPKESHLLKKRNIIDNNDGYSTVQYHLLKKRVIDAELGIDYINTDDFKDKVFIMDKNNVNGRHDRATPNGPIVLTSETFIVTDDTIYIEHQGYANTTNQNLVLLYMRVYFSHLMNIVNQKYVLSLQNDPDLRLSVVIKGFLFLTTASESTWTDRAFVGISSYPTFNGREVISGENALNSLRLYLPSKGFSYDLAVGFTNKDLWYGTGSDAYGVVGLAFVSAVCTNYQYAIIENFSGFGSAGNIAHELGHSFGSRHDGATSFPLASGCPASDNYIMVPYMGGTTNIINQMKFSNCSITQFKATLLSTDLQSVSSNGQCLTNTPINLPLETTFANLNQSGLIWTADDQCKLIFGPDASFCRAPQKSDSICMAMGCRRNLIDQNCYYTLGFGALDNTPCESGKSCYQMQCVNDSKAPTGNCINGEGYVTQNIILNITTLPSAMTCPAIAQFLKINTVYDFATLCGDTDYSNLVSTCCLTCPLYSKISCIDKSGSCPHYKAYCKGYVINGTPVDTVCKYTCGTCQRTPLTCSESSSFCLNGATCVNKTETIPTNETIAFNCICKTGYYGDYCENYNPCLTNPCLNGGTCQRIGSNGYACYCSSPYNGQNCENGVGIEVNTTSTTTTSTTTTPTTSITTTTTTTSTSTTSTTTTPTTSTTTTTTTTSTTTTPTTSTTTTSTTSTTSTTTTQTTSTTTTPTTSTTTTTTTTSTTTSSTTTTTTTTTTTSSTTTTISLTDTARCKKAAK